MNGEQMKVIVEQTHNRHSRAYVRDGSIVIRLAKNLSGTEEHRHIESLLRRMSGYIERERRYTTINPLRPILDGAQELTLEPVIGSPLIFRLRPGTRSRTTKTPDGWTLTIGKGVRRKTLHRLLWKLVGEHCRSELETLMDEINDQVPQVSWKRLKIGYAASQWGSCGPDGTIMLNSVLLFTSPDILRYVIVHEFAHCRVKGHSRAFWEEVEKACPDHKEIRKRVKMMRICRL